MLRKKIGGSSGSNPTYKNISKTIELPITKLFANNLKYGIIYLEKVFFHLLSEGDKEGVLPPIKRRR